MLRKRQTRRRDSSYQTTTFTVNPRKLARLNRIARKHFPNRSAAIERGIDLLIDQYSRD